VIAQAGRKGAVTIATNMAGRGTDILLGGNPEFLARELLKQKGIDEDKATEDQWKQAYEEATKITKQEKEDVIKAGGLLVIGTERHESRRVDNQLRGRSGRQGDPGETRFVLSLEDDLLRIFGGDRIKKLMEFMKIPEGEPIESSMVSKSLEGAQERVELQNFQSRKRLIEYDEVINIQRSVVYDIRRSILFKDDIKDEVKEFIRDVIHTQVFTLLKDDEPELWELEPLKVFFKEWIDLELTENFQAKDREELEEVSFDDHTSSYLKCNFFNSLRWLILTAFKKPLLQQHLMAFRKPLYRRLLLVAFKRQ
jgi:preprotein translocase subunit SecA